VNDHDSISFELAGETKDGTELWALYRFEPLREL